MKNKEFQKLLKKQKFNSNSGFTLTELLVGLFMSIFVIGALGFGLMTVLRTTQSENSKAAARNENSRALDFISDEIRRAKTIESFANSTNAPNFSATDSSGNTKTVVLALDIPEISESATLDSDDNASTNNERIVYYLKSSGNGSWKGPQVLYRWGPPLGADGSYTDNAWTEQALIDGINNTTVSSACPAGTTTTPTTPQGFYACITGSNAAQLYLTGQTKTAFGANDTQTNDSKVVARAKIRAANKTDIFNSIDWSVKGLGSEYNCKLGTPWDMKTEFSNSDDPNNTTSWTQSQDSNKQPQAIEIDPTKLLTITSTPVAPPSVNASDCNSIATSVTHTINFNDPITFNGDCDSELGDCSSYNNITRVKGNTDETVQFFKKGYTIPGYGGYVGNPIDTSDDQPSLGKFLYNKGLAIPIDGGDPNNLATTFKIPNDLAELKTYLDASGLSPDEKQKFKVLGDDQRILGFEIGQTSTTLDSGETNPGFDLQDNIFVVTSDIFKKKFNPNCFGGSGCSGSASNASS